jgi:hypothetical protein
MQENIPFLNSNTQLYPSWIYVITFDCWAPPVGAPKLTQEQEQQGYEYVWDENLYQENGAMGNMMGWILTKKSS